MRILDSHVHFPVDKILDDGKEGVAPDHGPRIAPGMDGEDWVSKDKAKWAAAWRFPKPVKVTETEAETLWAAEVASVDELKRVVFVTTGSNDRAAALVARHPGEFTAYAHHDPLLPDAADRLDRALKAGLAGYKLLGPEIDRPIQDPSFFPLWEIARDAGVPVLIHFGIQGGAGGIANHVNINPLSLHAVAKAFPTVPFIIPHFGCGYVFETLQLGWACPNVLIDTSGSNQWMRWMPYEVTLEGLFRKYRDTFGAGRILFGTDSSWFPRGFTKAYLDEQVRAMVHVGYTEDERDQVLYRNAASLLKIKD